MNYKTFLVSFICATTWISVYAQEEHWAEPDDALAKEIIAKEKMWAESNCSPQPGLKDVFADDFQGTSTSGIRYGKADAMETDMKNLHRDCLLGEVKVRFFGDMVAIVYGTESSFMKDENGIEHKRCLVWSDTWLKRDGKWQIIAAQDNKVDCPK